MAPFLSDSGEYGGNYMTQEKWQAPGIAKSVGGVAPRRETLKFGYHGSLHGERMKVVSVRKTVSKILHFYKVYKGASWLVTAVLTAGVPIAGYLAHAFGVMRLHKQLAADDPESARSQSIGTPVEWITDPGNTAATIAVVSLIVGVVLVSILIVVATLRKVDEGEQTRPGGLLQGEVSQDPYEDGYMAGLEDERYDEDLD